jgi:protein-disulfide isomerase
MRLHRFALLAAVALVVAGCPSEKTGTSASAEPGSSAAAKPLNLPGIDTAALSPREKREFTAQVRELLAPCPEVPVSLAQCLEEKRPCAGCKPATDMLLRMVVKGVPKKDREQAIKSRFDPKAKKNLDVTGSPIKGPEDAPVTVVEWADFECPFCSSMVPILDALVERFPGQVRVVFKFYPLTGHKNGEPAARAAIAAMNQGKFWEAHKKLFDNQGKLESSDLNRIAKELELDVPKWRADLGSDATTDRLKKDRELADQIGLTGTPLIYIEGREVPLEQLVEPFTDLESWISLELEMKNLKPAPKPAGFKGPTVMEPPPISSADLEALVNQLASAAPSASAAPRASAAPSAPPGAAPQAPPSSSAPPKK